MICIKANIRLYNVRKTPFGSGYHPLFNFVAESKVGGRIRLLDRVEFLPGETGLVEIWFPVGEYLGDDFSVGTRFTFDEGTPETLGDGVVEEISECDPPFPITAEIA